MILLNGLKLFMRLNINKEKLLEFMQKLGSAATTEGNCYFTGGCTAVFYDFRDSTIDIDLKFDPEPASVFNAIPSIKNKLNVNIELASPDQFVPQVEGWRERSIFIAKYGKISFYHYDLVSQVLAKLERRHEQDLLDVNSIFKAKLVSKKQILDAFKSILERLNRYPAIDQEDFTNKVTQFLNSIND